VAVKIVSRLAVAIRWATYCLQTHPIGDFPLWNENTRIVIGRQPWISVYSNTGRGIDIIFSLNTQQECVHSLIVVEKEPATQFFTLS
jgi:hypothetical protein